MKYPASKISEYVILALRSIASNIKLCYLSATILLPVLSSCSYYYKVDRSQAVKAETLSRLQIDGKYFILHFPDTIVGLKNLRVEANLLEAETALLSNVHAKNLHPRSTRANRYKKVNENNTLSEVHLYSVDKSALVETTVHMPLSEITRMDVYNKDRTNNTIDHIGKAAAVAGLIALVFVIGALASIATL